MPHDSGLLKALRAEAFSTTTHIRNRTPRSALEGRTHYEMVYGVKLDPTDLHALNAPCSIIEPSDQVSSFVHQVVNTGMRKTYKGFGECEKGELGCVRPRAFFFVFLGVT